MEDVEMGDVENAEDDDEDEVAQELDPEEGQLVLRKKLNNS
jgi:hypothetical protein